MVSAFIRWCLLLIANVLVLVLAYLLAPILPAFATKDAHLPRWLSWFDQPDDDLDGDNGWKTEHRLFLGHSKVDQGWRRYINRVLWLIRNPAYGWDISVLGFTVQTGFVGTQAGNQAVSDRPLCQGWSWRTVQNPGSNRRYWFLYIIWCWSGRFCLSIKLGWKIWLPLAAGDQCQFVCSLNPFASYAEGKNYG